MAGFLFSFSGRVGRRPYLLFTIGFTMLVLAAALSGPVGNVLLITRVLSSPWMQLAAAADRLANSEAGILGAIISLAVAVPLIWIWAALTIRRLRELGQSPWWTFLMGGGWTLPVMWALSLARSGEESPRPADGP